MIARSILYNLIGGVVTILLYLIVVPIQIRHLGIDAYGLLAFISTVQIIFSICDFGLSTTLAREVAIDTTPELRHTRTLLQSLLLPYALVGMLLGVALIVAAPWLARHWLALGALPVETAQATLQLSGMAIILRWPVSFLSAVLIGRGRFDLLNLLKIIAVIMLVAGGIVVILRTGDLVAFAAWSALTGGIEVTLYLLACFRVLPHFSLRPRVSRTALAQIWQFARDVGIITVLATIILQSDRLMLSRLAPIEQVGYYALAYSIFAGLTLVQGFVTSVLLPAFAAGSQRGETGELTRLFVWASQGLVFMFMPAVAGLVFFGGDFLRVWTSAETAAGSAPLLRIMAPAFLISVTVGITSTLAIATGFTSFIVRVTAVGMVCYLPALYFAIRAWGPLGAACAWLTLNLATALAMAPLVSRLVVGTSWRQWMLRDILPLVIAGAAAFGLAREMLHLAGWNSDTAIGGACLAAGLVYTVVGLRFLNADLRARLWQSLGAACQLLLRSRLESSS
ncbi:MAG: oligosaccharide flippase family protein [Thermomicrobiales bacterium]